MGSGSYDYSSRSIRAQSAGYSTKSTHEIFESRSINVAMSPLGVDIRESRDSAEHPNSYPIIIALDVTGSMGSVPHYLVKEGLPNIMKAIMEKGIEDPQILFVAVGDHEYDKAPLQVGQFESSDELLDHWLTKVYLEGGGGGNGGESYMLAHYFAIYHTATDSLAKRGKKGVLITIGDELNLRSISGSTVKSIMGTGREYKNSYTSSELISQARESWEVYHLHTNGRTTQNGVDVASDWRELIGDGLIVEHDKSKIAKVIADVVIKEFNKNASYQVINNFGEVKEQINIQENVGNIIL